MGSCHSLPHSSHGPGVGGDQASVCGRETGLDFMSWACSVCSQNLPLCLCLAVAEDVVCNQAMFFETLHEYYLLEQCKGWKR